MTSVLIADDEPGVLRGFERIFAAESWRLLTAGSGEEALELFRRHRPEVVVMDLRMPGGDGLEALKAIRALDPRALVILMTAFGAPRTVIEAMKAGAFEYIQKPFSIEKIREVVREAVEAATRMRQVVTYPPLPAEDESGIGIIGNSAAMQEVYKRIGQVAGSRGTVLITGESGAGKELVARAIYHHSDRADHPFLAVNCAAIPETLLESELFGHERGAFTGAVARRPGKFEAANGGVLFLDEIGDLSPATQAKLLRVLQSGEVKRIGANTPLHVDVRVIAATHRDLEALVREERFRADLFYRLNVLRIQLPPLRERREDIPALIESFARKYQRERQGGAPARFAPEAIERLMRHDWPGNVRELENCVRMTLLTLKGDTVFADDLVLGTRIPDVAPPPGGAPGAPAPAPPATAPAPAQDSPEASLDRLLEPLFERFEALRSQEPQMDLFDLVERALVRRALQAAGGNQSGAARRLGISRTTLRKRMERYGFTVHGRVETRSKEEGE